MAWESHCYLQKPVAIVAATWSETVALPDMHDTGRDARALDCPGEALDELPRHCHR